MFNNLKLKATTHRQNYMRLTDFTLSPSCRLIPCDVEVASGSLSCSPQPIEDKTTTTGNCKAFYHLALAGVPTLKSFEHTTFGVKMAKFALF